MPCGSTRPPSGPRNHQRAQNGEQPPSPPAPPTVRPAPSGIRSSARIRAQPAPTPAKPAPTREELHQRNAALHGLRVRKSFEVTGTGNGKRRRQRLDEHWGTVVYLGRRVTAPYFFRVKYDDGDEETVTWEELQLLFPPSPGTDQLLAPVQASPEQRAERSLVAMQAMNSTGDLLQRLMPGHWSPSELRAPTDRYTTCPAAHIESLLAAVDFSWAPNVMGIWFGRPTLQRMFAQQGLIPPRLPCPREEESAQPWLQPAFYTAATARRPLHAIVSNLAGNALSTVMGLTTRAELIMGCFYASAFEFGTHACPRTEWLLRLQADERLQLLRCRSAQETAGMWCIVFKDSATRRQLLQPELADMHPLDPTVVNWAGVLPPVLD